ncbi:hypothetical protein NGM37_57395, partial [Streptomyces sp. TRM76130]|nr:hypothetical protein [Streptomyces sp. TRM76130]
GGRDMRGSHRVEAERLLVRAVEEEVRRTGGRADGEALLSRARGAPDSMARSAAEEYTPAPARPGGASGWRTAGRRGAWAWCPTGTLGRSWGWRWGSSRAQAGAEAGLRGGPAPGEP